MKRKLRHNAPPIAVTYLFLLQTTSAIILSGGPNSYARYPKWAHSYENSLSLELKTRQSDGMLLYTDDGGQNGNFYALTIADGRIQLDFRLGDNANEPGKRPVNTIRIEDVRVDDDRWHTLSVFQSWENVKIELDQTTAFRILYQRSFVFGNLLKNSDVYVGGIPKDLHLLPTMSSPLRRHTKHLAGNVRNLLYRLYPQGVTSPQLLEAYGTRQSDEDFCRTNANSLRDLVFCQNEGYCYSTNDGPKCDCSATDYEGPHCVSEKPDGELSFFGQEWVGYDVSNATSAPTKTKRETIHMMFKTVHGEALLFYAGDETNFLRISIEDGAVHAYSKFEGTEQRMVRMFNSINSGRYDDDLWHNIIVDRSLHLLVLTVDGQRDEIRQYAPETDWIGHSFAFVGGLPRDKNRLGVRSKPFRGCMRQVRYEADAQQVLFVNLADEGFGESVIRTGGELAFSCKNPQVPPDVLSFNTSDSYIALPKWNSLASGSISFQFRTPDPDGLILFHGDVASSSDFVAFELIDGHLFLVIDLGSGHVRLQTTSERVDASPSQWHTVLLERVGRTGSVVVDSVKTDFSTPGVSSNLIVDDPVYIGAIPFRNDSKRRFPSSVWSITLRKGFIGCIKNVRFNGISSKISTVFQEQNATGVSMGCPNTHKIDFCEGNPCQNFGRCQSGFSTFQCDCSGTGMEGVICGKEPPVTNLNPDRPLSVVLPTVMASEAESVELRFRTDIPKGILLDTRSVSNRTHRFVLQISSGELELFINFGKGKHTFNWGRGLHDNRWHEARMKRRGERLLLYLDGKWEHSYFLPAQDLVLEVDELALGHSLHSESGEEPFRGQLTSAKFNHLDLLSILRKEGRLHGSSGTSKESKGQRNIKTKSPAVSFTNTTGFVTLAPHRVSRVRGDFRVSFKFQTLSRHALLFATSSIDTTVDSVIIELVHGRIRYTYRAGLREETIASPQLPFGSHLSDLRWHSLLVYQDGKTGEHVLLVDNTTSVLSKMKHHRAVLAGTAYFAGIPPSSPVSGRLATVRGLRGCLSSLRLGDENLDILDEAERLNAVVRGCQGPLAKCSPGVCSNGGRCIQQWNSIRCDCSLTAHAGERCNQPATTYTFPREPSVIFYEYSEGERPSTEKDFVVLAFKTSALEGVLLSIECLADRDYLALFLRQGLLVLRFNLGSVDHFVPLTNTPMNDGIVHVVKLFRADANITAVVDKYPPVRYRPEISETLVTLNMQWRISLGSALNAKHLMNGDRVKRHLIKIIDPFEGDIGGVNFNGLNILDLHAQGHPNVRAVGGVRLAYEAPPKMHSSAEDIDFDGAQPSPFFEAIGPSCLSIEEQESCLVDPEPIGFFTPQLPTAVTASRRVQAATHEKEKSSPTPFLPASSGRVTPYTAYPPVRPTTPMGDLITTTMKPSGGEDFPRTMLIMVGSGTVILLIAAIVFCVFKCRQNGPPPEHYPMVMNGKAVGYAPISQEMTPQMTHHGDPASQPLISPRISTQVNGYQPLKGAVIPNGNGITDNGMTFNGGANGAARRMNGGMNGSMSHLNGGGQNGNGPKGNAKKKDFKEWYV
ncbi:unnamed protein product, partial [Mesorhabditis spiculigera]